MTSKDRPSRISMEGMIWNANQILEYALAPKLNGIPRSLFEIAKGLVIISIVEVGFIFSGNVGSGIILKHLGNGKWSPPAACGLTGLGWGFLVGASVKDLMIFVMDDETMNTIQKNAGVKLGTQSEMTLGPLGRTYNFDINASKGGLGSTIAIAFSKGAFIGLSVSGAVLAARPKVNEKFYAKSLSTQEILNSNSEELLPQNKITMIDEVYDKLKKIEEGLILEAIAILEEEKKKRAAAQAAEAEAEMKNHEQVEEVNSEQLAAAGN